VPLHRMRLIYHPAAEDELVEAPRFYEERIPSLGAAFLEKSTRLSLRSNRTPKDTGSSRKKSDATTYLASPSQSTTASYPINSASSPSNTIAATPTTGAIGSLNKKWGKAIF